jgi:hypothetical protein
VNLTHDKDGLDLASPTFPAEENGRTGIDAAVDRRA